MSLIVFSDVILDECIALYGVIGRDIRFNDRSQNQAGFDTVNVVWQNTLREFTIGIKPMLSEDWEKLIGLYELTEGGAYGFLMLDPKDSVVRIGQGFFQGVTNSTPLPAYGNGYGVPEYQAGKRYQVTGSSRFKDRKITRLASDAQLFRGAAPLVEGDGPGEVEYNAQTGRVIFQPDSTESTISVTTGGATILNFNDGTGIVSDFEVGDRVYITSTTGTAADLLNDRSHVITNKGAASLTIEANTLGMTASGALALKYPQPDETLTWHGTFYVPVHFIDDTLDWQIDRPGEFEDRLVSGPNCVLIEVRE